MTLTPVLRCAIQRNFPGRTNAGLRARLYACIRNDGDVALFRHTVALTAQGTMSLAAVVQAVRNAQYDALGNP